METLSKIEKELVDNQERLNRIDYDMRENYSEPEADYWTHEATEINNRNKVLEIKRKHALDRRDGWVSRFIWSVLAPILLTIVTAYLINLFRLK